MTGDLALTLAPARLRPLHPHAPYCMPHVARPRSRYSARSCGTERNRSTTGRYARTTCNGLRLSGADSKAASRHIWMASSNAGSLNDFVLCVATGDHRAEAAGLSHKMTQGTGHVLVEVESERVAGIPEDAERWHVTGLAARVRNATASGLSPPQSSGIATRRLTWTPTVWHPN